MLYITKTHSPPNCIIAMKDIAALSKIRAPQSVAKKIA